MNQISNVGDYVSFSVMHFPKPTMSMTKPIAEQFLGDALDWTLLEDGQKVHVGDFLLACCGQQTIPDREWRIVKILECSNPECHVIYLEHRHTKARCWFTSAECARIMAFDPFNYE